MSLFAPLAQNNPKGTGQKMTEEDIKVAKIQKYFFFRLWQFFSICFFVEYHVCCSLHSTFLALDNMILALITFFALDKRFLHWISRSCIV